ncbi:MAG: hypothetical protein H6673_03865 [Anaerolineales bacterium]|nr:hypothetical protein [Anaerolineales bacterium]
MKKDGLEVYDFVSVFFVALTGAVCLVTLLIMTGLVSPGAFAVEDPTATVTQIGPVTITPSPPPPTSTATATAIFIEPSPSPTWTDFPTATITTTPTQTPSP